MIDTPPQATRYAEQRKRIAAQFKDTLIERLDLDRNADEIPDDCPLYGIGLGLDSIDSLEIVVAVEGEFGIRVEDDELKSMQSVNAIVDLIVARRNIRPHAPKRDYQRMRTSAGLADLQTWARFEVTGPEAGDAIDAVVGCNVRDLFEGRAAHTLIPSSSGGVDAIVWIMALETSYRIVAQPAERAAIAQALKQSTNARDAELHDIQDEQFALALIGPEAERVAQNAFGDDVESIAFLNVLPLGNPAVLGARLGHFGEYELHLFGETAGKQALIDTLERATDEHTLRVGTGALPGMMTEMGTLSRRLSLQRWHPGDEDNRETNHEGTDAHGIRGGAHLQRWHPGDEDNRETNHGGTDAHGIRGGAHRPAHAGGATSHWRHRRRHRRRSSSSRSGTTSPRPQWIWRARRSLGACAWTP